MNLDFKVRLFNCILLRSPVIKDALSRLPSFPVGRGMILIQSMISIAKGLTYLMVIEADLFFKLGRVGNNVSS